MKSSQAETNKETEKKILPKAINLIASRNTVKYLKYYNGKDDLLIDSYHIRYWEQRKLLVLENCDKTWELEPTKKAIISKYQHDYWFLLSVTTLNSILLHIAGIVNAFLTEVFTACGSRRSTGDGRWLKLVQKKYCPLT